ncbi:MAG TPA: hypothetical protein VH720_15105, partial [Candidatus Limnocylindrales bacterium]
MTLGIGRTGPLGPTRFAPIAAGPRWPAPDRAARPGREITTPREREALAVLVSVDGVGPATLGRLLRNVGTAIDVLERARQPDGDRFLLAASREPLDDDRWSPPSLTPRAAALLV